MRCAKRNSATPFPAGFSRCPPFHRRGRNPPSSGDIMIRECKEPECFKGYEGNFVYFEGYDKRGAYGYVAFTPTPPHAVFHLEITRFNHNILKKLMVDWKVLQKTMKKVGIDKITIIKDGNLKSNKSYIKFLEKMGMSEPHEILIANYELLSWE